MELSCIEHTGFAVAWKQLGTPELKVLTTSDVTYFNNAVPQAFKIYRSDHPDINLTWEWEELAVTRMWLTTVGLKSAYTHSCDNPFEITRYFYRSSPSVDFNLINGQIITYDPEEGAPDYDNGNPKHVYSTLQFILAYSEECQPFLNGIWSTDATIKSMTPKDGVNSTWNIKIYQEDVLIAEHNLKAQMNEAPTHLLTTYNKEGFTPKEKIFEKNPNTEGIKLEKIPGEDYQWHVIKVFLDENLQEIGQKTVYVIHGDDPELYCLTPGTCPENTCEVECGNTICCYNSQGYSVTSFPKVQS